MAVDRPDSLKDAAPASTPVPARGITTRAVVIGLVCSAILGVITPYCDLVLRGTWIACCHLPIGVFVLFIIILLGLNAPLYRFASRLGLAAHELYTIYAMMLVGAGIPSFGLTEYLFPTLAGAYYFASPENGWVERTFQYIPQWLVPFDVQGAMLNTTSSASAMSSSLYTFLPEFMQPGDRSVVTGFYEGLRVGQRLPWGAWSVPIISWTLAALLIFFCMICLSTILRKRWIEHERLVFPLVQIPLELVQDQGAKSPLPSFFRNRLMWIAFAIPVLVHSLNGLHFYFPAVPEMKLIYPLNQYLTGRIWSQIGIFTIFIHFSVIGFAYLISTELAFSFWFFFLCFILQGALFSYMGVQLRPLPGYPTPPHAALQMIGAFITLFGYMAWASRRQLFDIWQQAVRPVPGADDGEPMPFRKAVFGLLLGVLALTVWCMAAGLNPWLALAVFGLFFMFAIMLTRLVSEGGLLFVQAFRPTDVMIAGLGTSILGARSLTLLSFIQKAFMFDLRASLMPSLMDVHKLSHAAGLHPRRLLPWLSAAIIVSVVSSYVSFLLMAYNLGGIRFTSWFMINSPQQTLQFVVAYLNNPYPTTVANWVLMIAGGVITVALSLMRSLYAWWPLHPLGYAMGPSWPMIQLWFSVMIGWALKSVILRYGGFRRFRDLKPFFLGLIVGEYSAAGLWLLIDFVFGKSGHRFFLT